MAMTRQQILLEQSDIHHSVSANSYRGSTVHIPFGTDRWRAIDFRAFSSSTVYGNVDTWGVNEDWVYRCCAGSYHTVNHATALAFPGGNWSPSNTNGWNRWLYDNDITNGVRPMVLTVPATHTDVWINVIPTATSTTAAVVSVAGDAVATVASINANTTNGDFGSAVNLLSWVKVATVPGGADGSTDKVTLTPPADGTEIRVVGWLTCAPGTSADPSTGVYDPDSIVKLLYTQQAAPGPLRLQFTGDAASDWWGYGHFTTHNLPASGSATASRYYGAGTAWAPADNQRVTQVTTAFTSRLACDIQFRKTATSTNYTVGTHEQNEVVTVSGYAFYQRQVWNATAATQNLNLAGGTTAAYGGGYSGQWGCAPEFTRGKAIPYGTDWEAVNAFDDAAKAVAYGDTWALTNGSIVLLFTGYSSLTQAAGGIQVGEEGNITSRSNPDFVKFYKKYVPDTENIALAENDVTYGLHYRMAYPASQLRAGASGGGSGLLGGLL